MVVESFSIILVGILLLVAFLRSKHPGYLVATLPVFFIPVGHLLIRFVLYLSKGAFFGFRAAIVVAFADMLALALSCVFVIVLSRRIPSKRIRQLYIVIMLIYSILLGWAYILNALSDILM